MKNNLKRHFEKIISSKTFNNKDTQKRILEYIYRNGDQTISENDIAKEVFLRNDFDYTEDTIVRVNIYKLRQLLHQYYLFEGRNDVLKVSIPKGKYKLVVQGNSSDKQENNQHVNKVLLALILVLLLIIVFFLLKPSWSSPTIKNPLWQDFNFHNPTTILVGAPYFKKISEKEGEAFYFVRDHLLNSNKQEFEKLQRIFPDSSYAITEMDFWYVSPSSFYGLPPIIKDLQSVDNVKIELLPKYNRNMIMDENIIYCGDIKSLEFLEFYLEKTSFSVKRNNGRPGIFLHDTVDFTVYSSPSHQFYDYVLFVKVKGETGKPILILSDSHATGVRGVISVFKSGEIYKMIGTESIPSQFELLMKIKGYEYSNYDMELVHFQSLEN